MICTQLLRSPFIDEDRASAVESRLSTRLGVDNSSAEVLYRFVSGTLPGSWSSAIAINVKRQQCVGYNDPRHPKDCKIPKWVVTPPYVTIEASVHKQIAGHNIFGGPMCPVESARWFVDFVADSLQMHLPSGDRWFCDRCDWAEVYDLGSLAAVLEYQRSLALARMTRRNPFRFKDETVMFPGHTTTWKSYSKGTEFSKHDFRRIMVNVGREYAEELQELANRLLRVEVSVKARKIDELTDFRLVSQLSRDQLEEVYDNDTRRILREAEEDMKIVRDHGEVKSRLYASYDEGLARILYGTWMNLATCGEVQVRREMSPPTFRRHRKMLEEVGISWIASDVFVRDAPSLIPVGFSPQRSDVRRLADECEAVSVGLEPYRIAA